MDASKPEKILIERKKRQRTITLTAAAFLCVIVVTNVSQAIYSTPTPEIENTESIAFASKPEIKEESSSAPSQSEPQLQTEPQLQNEPQTLSQAAPAAEVDTVSNDSIVLALKEENQLHKNLLQSFSDELSIKENQIFQIENQLEELARSKENLQATLTNTQNELITSNQTINQMQLQLQDILADFANEQKAKQAEIQLITEQLDLQKDQLKNQELGLMLEIAFRAELQKETNLSLISQYQLALEENKKLQAEHESYLQEISALQEKYSQEVNLRLSKEYLLAQVADTLLTQKQALENLEKTQQNLAAEQQASKELYDTYLKEVALVVKNHNEPLSQESINQELINPGISTSAPLNETPQRIHIVAKGETLSGISLLYYGTSKRWNEIYEANKELLSNKNQIKTGIKLTIP